MRTPLSRIEREYVIGALSDEGTPLCVVRDGAPAVLDASRYRRSGDSVVLAAEALSGGGPVSVFFSCKGRGFFFDSRAVSSGGEWTVIVPHEVFKRDTSSGNASGLSLALSRGLGRVVLSETPSCALADLPFLPTERYVAERMTRAERGKVETGLLFADHEMAVALVPAESASEPWARAGERVSATLSSGTRTVRATAEVRVARRVPGGVACVFELSGLQEEDKRFLFERAYAAVYRG